jgi:hypothetical protein
VPSTLDMATSLPATVQVVFAAAQVAARGGPIARAVSRGVGGYSGFGSMSARLRTREITAGRLFRHRHALCCCLLRKRRRAMTTLPDLIALAVLSGINPAGAPTSEPGQLPPSLLQETVIRELVARRLGAPYRYRGARQYRQYVSPPTKAAPMEWVPRVLPLAAACLELLVLEERPCGSRG